MKKFVSILLSIVSVVCIAFTFTACSGSSDNKEINGAYFLTDESYEKIITDTAKQYDLDESWIKSVLGGGDGGDYSFAVRRKDYYYCVIADNMLTYSCGINTVYNLEPEGTAYKCIPLNLNDKQASFRLKNDLLYLTIGETTFSFKINNSYTFGAGKKFTKLKDYSMADINEEQGMITLIWDYLSEYGDLGMAIEIKTAKASEYKIHKIEHWYQNMYVVEFFKDDFEYGKNYVRLYNIGGPTITNTNEIIVCKNSDYIEFCIEKSNDNKLTYTKI